MATYLIGDVHGCYHELIKLLKQVKFVLGKDVLWLTGDLVGRGPDSLRVLRYVKSLGDSVRIVLGNHDINLLSFYAGINFVEYKSKDSFISLIKAPDSDELLNWLRYQPLVQIDEEKKLLMIHAGIIPQWDLKTLKESAHDVETILTSKSYPLFLKTIYDDSISPNRWNKNLSGLVRLKFIINVLTRIRYCFPDGKLDMHCKDAPKDAPWYLKPWFTIYNKITEDYNIVFGHWASLGAKNTPDGIYALDTGCCWGGKLTCLRWEDKKYYFSNLNSYSNSLEDK